MDLSNSVILPREDFAELQETAWTQTPTSASQRVASTIQTSLVIAGLAAGASVSMWVWVKAMDWREERIAARMAANPEYKQPNRF